MWQLLHADNPSKLTTALPLTFADRQVWRGLKNAEDLTAQVLAAQPREAQR